MKPAELREMNKEELLNLLAELKEESFNLRFQKSVKLLSNPHKPRQVRKDIARIETRLRELSTKEAS